MAPQATAIFWSTQPYVLLHPWKTVLTPLVLPCCQQLTLSRSSHLQPPPSVPEQPTFKKKKEKTANNSTPNCSQMQALRIDKVASKLPATAWQQRDSSLGVLLLPPPAPYVS